MANGATGVMGSNNYLASTAGTIAGPRFRGDVQAARRVIQSGQGVLINANVTPLLAATEKVGKGEICYGSVMQHNEYDVIPGFVVLDATGMVDGTGTTMTFVAGQGSRVTASDTLKYLATGEIVFVASISGDVATVIRAYTNSSNTANVSGTNDGGGAAGAVMPASAELQILRPAFSQNSLRPKGTSVEPLIVYTYLQCSRYVVEASRRTIDSQNYALNGKASVDEWQRIHDDEIKKGQYCDERALLHNQGTASIDVNSSTGGGTMTDGIPARILTNRFNISGSLDEVAMTNYVISVFRYNQGQTDKLITFVGDNVDKTIDQFARDNMRYQPDIKILGSNCTGWQSRGGRLNFTKHGMFGPLSSSALYSAGSPIGWMLSVNFSFIDKVQFGKNGAMRYDPNAKTPGQDGTVGCWTEDFGIKMRNERAHGFMYGVSGL